MRYERTQPAWSLTRGEGEELVKRLAFYKGKKGRMDVIGTTGHSNGVETGATPVL